MSKQDQPVDIEALGVAIASALAAVLPRVILEVTKPPAFDPKKGLDGIEAIRHGNDGVLEAYSAANYGGAPALEERTGTLTLFDLTGPIKGGGSHAQMVVRCVVEIMRNTTSGPNGVVRNAYPTDEDMKGVIIPFYEKQWDDSHASQWREAEGLSEHRLHLEDQRAKETKRLIYWSCLRPMLNQVLGKAPDASGCLVLDEQAPAQAAAAAE